MSPNLDHSRPEAPPPLVLVGPTASGKSALALELAERAAARGVTVEVLSIDSMAVYRGMDVGTASPSPADRARVPHHLVDLVDPGEEFSVAQFRRAADAALADLDERGSVPMLVGGTGLYLRAVVDRLRLPGRYPEVAAALERERDTASLHRRLAALDPVAAGRIDPANRRRVVRALEVTLGAGRPFSSFGPGLDAHPAVPHVMVGLHVERDQLGTRIRARLAAQLAAGFLEEVRALADRPTGLSRTAAQALGYRELLAHLRGECTLEDAVELAVVRTRQFAVRQLRWFRRDPRIEWVDASLATGELADRIERRWLGVPNAMGRPGSGQLP